MKAAKLRAVTMRLDVLRDIMVELVAALPPDRAAGFAAALGNRLNGRICDMEIDERSDNAMVSDLAPAFAAVSYTHLPPKRGTRCRCAWLSSLPAVPRVSCLKPKQP